MVVLLSHGHHVGNGGAFITWALRFIVIAITIQHVCGTFIAWALLWSQCFRKMSHRRLSDITIVNRHGWTYDCESSRLNVMVVLDDIGDGCDSTQSPLPINVIAVLLSHGCFYHMGIKLEEGGRWHTDILLCWVGRRWKMTTTWSERTLNFIFVYLLQKVMACKQY